MIVVKLYVTLLSAIIAGLVNSIFCKLNVFKFLKKPIDNNIKLKDENLEKIDFKVSYDGLEVEL